MKAPECLRESYYRLGNPQFAMEKKGKVSNPLVVEDLLVLSHEGSNFGRRDDGVNFTQVSGNSTADSTVMVADEGSISSFSVRDMQVPADVGGRGFSDVGCSDDLCIPQDEIADLELDF